MIEMCLTNGKYFALISKIEDEKYNYSCEHFGSMEDFKLWNNVEIPYTDEDLFKWMYDREYRHIKDDDVEAKLRLLYE